MTGGVWKSGILSLLSIWKIPDSVSTLDRRRTGDEVGRPTLVINFTSPTSFETSSISSFALFD